MRVHCQTKPSPLPAPPAQFRVVKTNKRGKAQNRILELNFQDGVITVRSADTHRSPPTALAASRPVGERAAAHAFFLVLRVAIGGRLPHAYCHSPRAQNKNTRGKVQKTHHASKVMFAEKVQQTMLVLHFPDKKVRDRAHNLRAPCGCVVPFSRCCGTDAVAVVLGGTCRITSSTL
jgi:hypothetical protein